MHVVRLLKRVGHGADKYRATNAGSPADGDQRTIFNSSNTALRVVSLRA